MRIGIVNDLPMAVEALRRALALAPEHHVAWVAGDGAEAVRRCAEDTPDLVLMDLIMPGMDGVEATRRIMAATPCAILIVTVSIGANVARVFEAMGHGALDVIDTPVLDSTDLRGSAAPLLAKIRTIAKLIGDAGRRAGPVRPIARARSSRALLVAIGASTGGPAAVAAVLQGLPRGFPAALVVVQHVDEQFTAGMANWLNERSALPVSLAREDDFLQPGRVLLASTADHLSLKTPDRLGYTPDPRDYVYRPSVDVFFRSVAKLWSGDAVGVVLTGMGRDGALGLKALRDRSHHTIAQDEATSAVYGMPKAAAALNAAVDILPIERIASRLIAVTARNGEER